MTEESPLLEFDIAKSFSGFELRCRGALRNGITAIYGPSGSGKTTLLGCVAGLTTPDEGTIDLLGARVFDAAAAGLGGCPFAPGATGNTATEDLVFAFELMGISTGIDLDRLLSAAELAAGIEGGQAGGRVRLLPRKNLLAGLS